MPKIQSYVPAKTYKKMEEILDGLHQDGALRHEANISSIAAKLIDMGLILWEAQNKKKDETDGEGGKGSDVDSELFVRESLKGSYKIELYSQIFLQILLNPEMAKQAGDYESLKKQIHKAAEEMAEKLWH